MKDEKIKHSTTTQNRLPTENNRLYCFDSGRHFCAYFWLLILTYKTMNKDNMTKKELSDLWLQYYNDFLTIERFAQWHMMPKNEMIELLHKAKESHKELTTF